MSMKIVFSPDGGKLFGARIVGYEGVDKRIDVIAAILKYRGTVYDLREVEHAAQKQSNEDIFEKDVIGKDDNIYQAAVEK
jgi:hypothetical protein